MGTHIELGLRPVALDNTGHYEIVHAEDLSVHGAAQKVYRFTINISHLQDGKQDLSETNKVVAPDAQRQVTVKLSAASLPAALVSLEILGKACSTMKDDEFHAFKEEHKVSPIYFSLNDKDDKYVPYPIGPVTGYAYVHSPLNYKLKELGQQKVTDELLQNILKKRDHVEAELNAADPDLRVKLRAPGPKEAHPAVEEREEDGPPKPIYPVYDIEGTEERSPGDEL